MVYRDNTVGSYNVLLACEILGIRKICLASSINAIGGIYSRAPRYDYFPVDESHPTYNEDPYSLSKWVLERQADCFANRESSVSVSSMRFHAIQKREVMEPHSDDEETYKHLWAYSDPISSAKACLLSLQVGWTGHEAFFIVAPLTISHKDSMELKNEYYPHVKMKKHLEGKCGFYDCAKAERLLDWKHEDYA